MQGRIGEESLRGAVAAKIIASRREPEGGLARQSSDHLQVEPQDIACAHSPFCPASSRSPQPFRSRPSVAVAEDPGVGGGKSLPAVQEAGRVRPARARLRRREEVPASCPPTSCGGPSGGSTIPTATTPPIRPPARRRRGRAMSERARAGRRRCSTTPASTATPARAATTRSCERQYSGAPPRRTTSCPTPTRWRSSCRPARLAEEWRHGRVHLELAAAPRRRRRDPQAGLQGRSSSSGCRSRPTPPCRAAMSWTAGRPRLDRAGHRRGPADRRARRFVRLRRGQSRQAGGVQRSREMVYDPTPPARPHGAGAGELAPGLLRRRLGARRYRPQDRCRSGAWRTRKRTSSTGPIAGVPGGVRQAAAPSGCRPTATARNTAIRSASVCSSLGEPPPGGDAGEPRLLGLRRRRGLFAERDAREQFKEPGGAKVCPSSTS